jgi:ABC-type transport system involved in multi-copper enzyme maturation permease subunit
MKNIFTVAKYTFIEVYRSKVMMSIPFLALGLLVITYIASEFAYGAPAKTALDFGLGIMAISNLGIAIFIGSTLLMKEVEQRTLYMILSKPLSRSSFLTGKIIGLSSVLLANTMVLSILSFAIFFFLGGKVDNLFFWASCFSFLEAFIILLIAVLFSLITNTSMSVIYSIILVIVGHSLNETSKLLFAKMNPFFNYAVKFGNILLPNLYKLNLKDFVLYQQSVPFDYLLKVLLYFFCYTAALVIFVNYIFKNKNLD